MKLIVLIALFIVGVTSDNAEVTSASTTTTLSSSRGKSLKNDDVATGNRREGVSYSTSVIHRDPKHPESEAASSINFRLNTDGNKDTTKSNFNHYDDHQQQHHQQQHQQQQQQYTTPNSLYHDYHHDLREYSSQSGSEESGSSEHQNDPGQDQGYNGPGQGQGQDIVYGQNAVHQQQQPQQHHHQYYQNPPNHQPYYKPVSYAQPTITETKHKIEVLHPTPQYRYTSTHKTLTTQKPRTSSRGQYRPARPFHSQSQSQSQHSSSAVHANHAESSKLVPHTQAYTQAIFPGSSNPKPEKTGKSISSFPSQNHNQEHQGQSQSFNVGYSVKFGVDHGSSPTSIAPKKLPLFKPTTRIESDIITGSHKEEVSKPLHLRVHGVREDKGKFSYAAANPHQILSQANLSPKTQKQLAFLENIQSHKFIQKEPISSNFPWKNLSPSVEIYKSKEISLPGTVKNTYGFDHDRAIGKSEGFDYTNAVEYMKQQLGHGKAYLPVPGIGQETQQVQVQAQVQLEPQVGAHHSFLSFADSGGLPDPDKIPPLPKLPIDTSLIREPYLTVHKEMPQNGHGHGHSSQIPIHFDTSLIQEMGNDFGHVYGQPQQIQETGSIGSAAFSDNLAQINNLLAEQSQQYHNYQQLIPSDNTKAPMVEVSNQPNIILLQQEVPQQPPQQQQQQQSKDLDMTFSYPQNGLFNPNLNQMTVVPSHKPSTVGVEPPVLFTPGPGPNSNLKSIDPQLLKHLKMYKVKEHVQDHVQPQQVKFKVFGKPGNAFMRHQYDKVRQDRPPRMQGYLGHGHGQGSSKRLVREYTNIEMDLRPPPMAIPFKSANFLRIKQ